MGSWATDGGVPAPLLALGAVGVLMVLLRWAFSGGRSLVQRRPRSGHPDEYGLLVRVAARAALRSPPSAP